MTAAGLFQIKLAPERITPFRSFGRAGWSSYREGMDALA